MPYISRHQAGRLFSDIDRWKSAEALGMQVTPSYGRSAAAVAESLNKLLTLLVWLMPKMPILVIDNLDSSDINNAGQFK